MRTELNVPHTIIVKLGVAVGALAIALPTATAAAQTPATSPAPPPSTGGLGYADASEPSVFADGSTLTAPVGNLLGQDVHVDGTVAGTHPGDAVQVQRLDPAAGWVTVATATVAADGSFDAAWTPAAAGATKLRAVPANQAAAARSTDATTAADADGRAFTVFRPVRASWYGPGFYGRRTACGRRMTTRLLGVAHRTLPCGTLVQLYNDGHTITVPVVDRGPFRRGTSYDLTVATARALGVVATTRLGAMRVP